MSKRVKNLITAELEKKFRGADSLVVINYTGIDATTANHVRAGLRAKKVKMTVIRNAMALKALANAGFKEAKSLITGTNAIVYGGESIVNVVKELVEQSKKVNKLVIKGAIVEGKLLDAPAAAALAKFPTRKELNAIILGQAVSPARQLAAQIKGPGGKIAAQIKTIIANKEKEPAAAAA